MSTSSLDRLASAAATELVELTAAGSDTYARRVELDRLRRRRRGAGLMAVSAGVVAAAVIVTVAATFEPPEPVQPAGGAHGLVVETTHGWSTVDVQQGTASVLPSGPGTLPGLVGDGEILGISSDGERVAFRIGNSIRITEVASGQSATLDETPKLEIYQHSTLPNRFAWSADLTSLAILRGKNHLDLVRVEIDGDVARTRTRAIPLNFPSGSYSAHSVSLDPTGSRLLVTAEHGHYGYHGALFMVDTDGSNWHRIIGHQRGIGSPYNASWSPDGSHIAVIASSNSINGVPTELIIDADGSHQKVLATTERGAFMFLPIWAPDGGSIAFLRGDIKDFRKVVMRGLFVSTLAGDGQYVSVPDLTPTSGMWWTNS